MEIKARPSTVLLFGCGLVLGFALLVLLVSGRDFSPHSSVRQAEHSAVTNYANAETAWQANSGRSAGPSQPIPQSPAAVNLTIVGSVTPPTSSEAVSVALSSSATVSNDTNGWRTPVTTDTTDEEQSSSTADAYQQEFRTQPPTTGQPTHRECMLAADDIVASGWHASPVEAACFTGPDDHAIGDAYGELESEGAQSGSSFTTDDVRPCVSEDGTDRGCYWNAAEQGNGQGRSFYVDMDGAIHYADQN